MDTRDLGRTGIKITPTGLGCWQFSQGIGTTGSMWSEAAGAMDVHLTPAEIDRIDQLSAAIARR